MSSFYRIKVATKFSLKKSNSYPSSIQYFYEILTQPVFISCQRTSWVQIILTYKRWLNPLVVSILHSYWKPEWHWFFKGFNHLIRYHWNSGKPTTKLISSAHKHILAKSVSSAHMHMPLNRNIKMDHQNQFGSSICLIRICFSSICLYFLIWQQN